MTGPIKVFLTEAFMPLLKELDIFGAMFRAEADQQFGADFVAAALARKVCSELETSYGPVVVLSARGRILLGYTGYYAATRQSAEANVCLRDAYLNIRQAGYEVIEVQRKRRNAVIFMKDGKKVIALVNPGGYHRSVARNVYRSEILSGRFDELHLYSYQSANEIRNFSELLFNPIDPSAQTIDATRLFLYSIVPWPETHSG